MQFKNNNLKLYKLELLEMAVKEYGYIEPTCFLDDFCDESFTVMGHTLYFWFNLFDHSTKMEDIYVPELEGK